jgi:putative membrane-bound dehydrogenase-like protein
MRGKICSRMKRRATPLLMCVAVGLFELGAHGAEFKLGRHTFTLPEGFEIEPVAGPPLVDRPVTADFDEAGRLYVTDSSGSNDKVEKQLQDKPHRILRLEDTDGDGRFDKAVAFADKMMFPEGCLWYRGSLYVSAPPSIWKLTDTDGDGVADRREEWLAAKTLTGCANDLHGPYLGPDGWIYWCKGAFAKQTYPLPSGGQFSTRAAHIFRARLDGTGIESVLTGGMDNPVSVTFTPGGERILTGTFFVHPGGGQRDGLIHAVYGGVYGKDHDVLDGHPRTGELMPIMTHHGPSASCFVLRYESGAFGQEYRDNLFACLFNLHKVTCHVLVPVGATFTTKDEDFLVSDNPDFHPTDLVEDADGSLLVVDTGGWYKICCPTSQLWKPDVLGAVYRVRKSGAPKVSDPRGKNIAWSSATSEFLASQLEDSRVAVQHRALDELAQRGPMAVAALQNVAASGETPEARRNAIWALTRIDGEGARAVERVGLDDRDASVQLAAIHAASVRRDRGSAPQLRSTLVSGSAPAQRAAAEALGRLGDATAVPALLQVASRKVDRVLEHSIIYALIEIGRPEAVRQELARRADEPYCQRAGLIALDQMEGGALSARSVTPLLVATDPVLRQTADWIVKHHPEWATALVDFFAQRLTAVSLGVDDRAELVRQLSSFGKEEAVQKLLVAVAANATGPEPCRVTALQAMARSGVKQVPSAWLEALCMAMTARQPSVVSVAVDTARALPLPKEGAEELAAALRRVGANGELPVDVRLNALAAVPGGLGAVSSDMFEFLRSNLDSAKPVLVRSSAADVLAKARLSDHQLERLTDSVQTAGPLEVPKLLSAFERTTNETIGLQLTGALKTSPGLAGLRPETLRARLTNFPETVRRAGAELAAGLDVDADKQKAHLDELLPSTKGGDVRRGQAVFNSQKAACSTCHAIGYLGGNVGPDLTRIGQVRTDRDLLEAIVYPSASFVRSYEPLLVQTRSGDDYSGVVRKDAPDELVLATGPGAEVHVARADIAEMRPGTVSVMPGGLEEQLSRQELADLIAFLRANR